MESALVCAFFREDFNKAKAEVESKKKAFTGIILFFNFIPTNLIFSKMQKNIYQKEER